MKSLRSVRAAVLGSIGLTAVLWILALLFKLRVAGVFQTILMKKFPGPAATIGAMVVCPIVALVLGIVTLRRGGKRGIGVVGILSGGLFLLLFAGVIGRPMVLRNLNATPLNPPAPRAIELQTGLPVFPGAEGFGTRTRAGRGGKVIEVTTLADDGPGSLRAAVEYPGPRIVVFRVGGVIELKTFLFINQPFITIAGQTAPGGGICLKDAGIVVSTNDVLIQHLRVRPGRTGPVRPEDNDAIAVLGKHARVTGAHHVVIDHVSASWSEDEVLSTWFGAHDVTISRSIIGEGLNRGRHEKGTHGAGLLIGDSSEHVTVHHCLLAHNDFRNPLVSLGGTHDLVNNVVYNWGTLPAEVFDLHANTFLNIVGNTLIPGPSSVTDRFEIFVNPTRERGSGRPKLYVEGNLGPHRRDPKADDWSLVGFGFSDRNPAPSRMRSLTRFATPAVTATEAGSAFESVLADSGATRPERDAVDRRVVADVTARTGRIIDSPAEVGGYPALAQGTPPADSDHDGMPDDWEKSRGLDPANPADGNGDDDGDGYTNIEEFLHSLL